MLILLNYSMISGTGSSFLEKRIMLIKSRLCQGLKPSVPFSQPLDNDSGEIIFLAYNNVAIGR